MTSQGKRPRRMEHVKQGFGILHLTQHLEINVVVWGGWRACRAAVLRDQGNDSVGASVVG